MTYLKGIAYDLRRISVMSFSEEYEAAKLDLQKIKTHL